MTTTGRTASPSASDARRQIIRKTIDTAIKANFSSTLGTEQDMTNIFLALTHLESHFNVNAVGKEVNEAVSSGARDYWNSTVIKTIRDSGSEAQKGNINQGKHAIGVAQVMGWNVIKGASLKTGKCVVESVRPDLVNKLCINPGEDLTSKYLGEANLDTAVTAGLAILESKWKAAKKTKDGWQIGLYTFPLRISAAVAGYLGLGAKDVVTGMTPQAYASSIVGGAHYAAANGPGSPAVRDSEVKYAQATARGPAITIASKDTLGPSGCVSETEKPTNTG